MGGFVVDIGDGQISDFDVVDDIATDALGAELGGGVLIRGRDYAVTSSIDDDEILIAGNGRLIPVRGGHHGIGLEEHRNTVAGKARSLNGQRAGNRSDQMNDGSGTDFGARRSTAGPIAGGVEIGSGQSSGGTGTISGAQGILRDINRIGATIEGQKEKEG